MILSHEAFKLLIMKISSIVSRRGLGRLHFLDLLIQTSVGPLSIF